MRRAPVTVCASLAALLAAGPGHAAGASPATLRGASPAPPSPGAPAVPDDDQQAVDLAEAAWSRGGWTEVRDVLEPLATDPGRLQDARLREKALTLLADATVNDPTLDEDERRVQAAELLERLLDTDPGWRLPPAIYSPELFELFADVQDQRSQRTSAQCEADRMACEADLADTAADLEDLRRRHTDLQRRYDDQEVEVRDRVARSRVFAAIPAGIGHFYNGDLALGGVFLGAEAILGATGLGLILYRKVVDGCDRTNGFARGSLECAAGRNIDAILRRRQAEEAIGWVFLGAIALDVFLAQYRFKPFKTQSVERVPRRELDADAVPADGRRRKARKPRAKVRPTGGFGPHGASVGIRLEF